jgi:putative transcriptional regulator
MKSMTIKELREQTGLNQSQFAKKFHISLRALQSWEQGWRNTPECILYMVQRIMELEADHGSTTTT